MLKLVCSQRSFFYFAGQSPVAEQGDGACTRDFIIIPNTSVNFDRFCGSAFVPVTSEFQVCWRVIISCREWTDTNEMYRLN